MNLRTRRKQAARARARAEGAARAARHGQARAEQELTRAQAEKAARLLDGHRREDKPD